VTSTRDVRSIYIVGRNSDRLRLIHILCNCSTGTVHCRRSPSPGELPCSL